MIIIKDMELNGHNYGDAEVKVGRYERGGVAIQLVEAESGMPLTKVTTYLPEKPVEGAFWLKSYGENVGMVLRLGMEGLIEFLPHIRTVDVSGHGDLAIETLPKGELKTMIDAEMAKWTV